MMTATRASVAYEYYEDAPAPQRSEAELQPAPEQRRRKKPRMGKGVAPCVAVMLLAAVYMLFCQMRLTMLTADVTEKTEQLDELTAESVYLSSKQAYSLDMDEIEEYATKNLGMVKMDNSQIEYVEMTNPDSVTVAEDVVSLDALFAGLARSFSAIVEYIS